eukprot:TRINITY_DN9846_c0_g1_i1.p1 TRINITY_DN9846_c0_g1~~TRINITY_DN9846_c0_g1_i1.p1  ORF type:complete len:203 (-),score=29.65 TRINITY_DN9846_c0_g1_i1:202-810(-)
MARAPCSAASQAAAARVVPNDGTYLNAARRGVVAERHTRAEVSRMLHASDKDLDLLPPKSERGLAGSEGDKASRRQRRNGRNGGGGGTESKDEPVPGETKMHGSPLPPSSVTGAPCAASDSHAVVGTSASGIPPRTNEQRRRRALERVIADSGVVTYLLSILDDEDDLDEAQQIVADTLRAHDVEEAAIQETCLRMGLPTAR